MTIVEMNERMLAFLNRCYATIESKNRDYHPEGVPMLEVFRAAAEARISPQQVLWGHLRKQLSAVRSHVINRQLESEPIDSRLTDVANYAALLQFLEANYSQLVADALLFIGMKTKCERQERAIVSCFGLANEQYCDRCTLLEWLAEEDQRCRTVVGR